MRRRSRRRRSTRPSGSSAAALSPLAEAGKLGYVLFQFAPWVHFGDRSLEYLASLPARLPGWRLAVEFRHRSWFPEHGEETLGAARAGLAHVIVDAPARRRAVPGVPAVTAPSAIFRLHGRNAEGWLRQVRGEEPSVREKYDYLYTEEELAGLVPEIEAVTEEAEETFVSFNNNNRDYPVQNALMMKRLLGQPVPERRTLRKLARRPSPEIVGTMLTTDAPPIPRVELAYAPTPLLKLERLSAGAGDRAVDQARRPHGAAGEREQDPEARVPRG